MQGFENHLQSAASQFSNGDLKDAYLSYLFAAQSLLSKLSTEIVFEDNNRISTQPEYVQSLFSISAKCLRSAEDIVCNRCVYSPSTHPLVEEERERESEIMDTPLSASPNIITVETTLPLIPLSPLTQMSIIHSSSLASASQKLTLAKRSKTPVGLPTLRRLTEDVRIQRGKLDSVNKQVKSVANAVICNWNPDAVAKQLTIIEAQLFSKLSVRKDFLAAKPRASKIQGCVDFHRYITNSVIHQIIAGSEVNHSESREYPRDYIIAHIIRVAYLLLHVYRNFSGFAAIIKALTSPEVRRLRKCWKKVPSKTKEMLKDLSRHIKEENGFRSYHEALSYKLSEVKEFGPGLVVIPWMERHLEKLEAVLKSYSTGRPSDGKAFDPSSHLSEPGARKLEAILFTVEQCQGNPSEDRFAPDRAKPARRRTFMEIDGAKSQIALPSNLLDIGGTDLGLHHWLVSRVYLTRYQLWEESLEYESPAFGELVPTFVKENGQTLVESHHLGRETDTAHFEDVGQFNDYFPSEGNRSALDLDRMESVDEFLSFLDQDLIESSTPNTSVPPAQHNGFWDDELPPASPTLTQTPDRFFTPNEKVFDDSQFKLDTPTPRNSILFNSVKPSSDFSSVLQDEYDDSASASPLPFSGVRALDSSVADASVASINGVDSQPLSAMSDPAVEQSDIIENRTNGHLVVSEPKAQEPQTDVFQEPVTTSKALGMNGDQSPPTYIESSTGEPIITNGIEKGEHSRDSSNQEAVSANAPSLEPNSISDQEPDVVIVSGEPENKGPDVDARSESEDERPDLVDVSSESEDKRPVDGGLDEYNLHPHTTVSSNGQLTDDSDHNLLKISMHEDHQPNSKDPLLESHSSLADSLPETPINPKAGPVIMGEFPDDGNSSEEEPRKFLSLEKLIQLNESSYADEKSDGDTSITVTDEEIEVSKPNEDGGSAGQ